MKAIISYHHHSTGTLITGCGGTVTQHKEYLPYGELLADEHLNSPNFPYKFQPVPTFVGSKELDEETRLYYYGARYYDPKVSLWLSVDPLAEKYPGMSPYTYTADNPVVLVDPDGRDWYQPLGSKDPTNVVWIDGSDEHEGYKHLGYNYYVDEYHFQFLGDTKSSYYTTISGERKLIQKFHSFKALSEDAYSNPLPGSSLTIKQETERTSTGVETLYGDKYTVSLSSGIYINIKGNATNHLEITKNYQKDGSLSSTGIGITYDNLSLGLQQRKFLNMEFYSSYSGYASSLSLPNGTGISGSITYFNQGKYLSLSYEIRPGFGTLAIFAATIAAPEIIAIGAEYFNSASILLAP